MQASSMMGNCSAGRACTRAPAVSRAQPVRVTTARPSRLPTAVVEARVALRFQRVGRKFSPFYRLVAIESKDRREGRPLEYLGCVQRGG